MKTQSCESTGLRCCQFTVGSECCKQKVFNLPGSRRQSRDRSDNRRSLLRVMDWCGRIARQLGMQLVLYLNLPMKVVPASAVALEDAGHTRQMLESQYQHRVGVFVGVTRTGFDLYGPELCRQDKSDINDCYVELAGIDKATVVNWNSDPDLLKKVTAWTEEGCYARLAELWVKGVNIDWSRPRRRSTICPRRISLPTYPFDTKRYWLELEGNESSQITLTVNTEAASGEKSSKAIYLNDQPQTVVSPKTKKLITLVDTDKVHRDRVARRNRQPIRLRNPAELTPQTKVTSSFFSLSQQPQGIVEIRIAAAAPPLDASKLSTELRDKMRSGAVGH